MSRRGSRAALRDASKLRLLLRWRLLLHLLLLRRAGECRLRHTDRTLSKLLLARCSGHRESGSRRARATSEGTLLRLLWLLLILLLWLELHRRRPTCNARTLLRLRKLLHPHILRCWLAVRSASLLRCATRTELGTTVLRHARRALLLTKA